MANLECNYLYIEYSSTAVYSRGVRGVLGRFFVEGANTDGAGCAGAGRGAGACTPRAQVRLVPAP